MDYEKIVIFILASELDETLNFNFTEDLAI